MILQSKMLYIRTFICDCILVLSEDSLLKRKTHRRMCRRFCLVPSACVLPQQLRSLLLLQLSAVVTMALSCKLVPYIVGYVRGDNAL
jgi:hypothetical protein